MEEGRARFLEASILGAQRDIPKAWGSFRAPCFLPATRGRIPRAEAAHGAGCAPTVGPESPPLPLWDQQPSRPRSSRQRSELTPLAPKIQGS